ncbi:MAG: phosphoribosylamine--glycine ligase [Euryarchaeota archaeon]|nr:phosphoribosylamine--glycine ligase [Euryarchaeota archaeon]
MATPLAVYGPVAPTLQTQKPLKFLFIGDWGLSLDVAWQCIREGHQAKMYIHDADCKDIGDNIVEKSANWEEDVAWADVIVFEDTGYGKHQDRLRKEGKPIVGGSELGDRLEDDRDFGQQTLKDLEVPTLDFRDFTDFDEARKWVTDTPGRYVLKPNGPAADFKGLAFVSKRRDSSDLVEMMDNLQAKWPKNLKPTFQLQKFAAGIEMAVGAFFNGTDWVLPLAVNFEHKKFLTGGLGPNTGEMGTSIMWEQDLGNRLFQATLAKVKPLLAADNYHGFVDINCIVNEQGAWPLEFTCRLGYPITQITIDAFRSPVGTFLEGLARGDVTGFRVGGRFSVGVVVTVPPFPFVSKPEFDRYSRDLPVFGVTKDRIDHVRLAEVKWDVKNDRFLTANESGYTLVVTGTGDSVEEAKRRAYAVLGERSAGGIYLPNMMYRTDIGDRWVNDEPKLQEWGYLVPSK